MFYAVGYTLNIFSFKMKENKILKIWRGLPSYEEHLAYYEDIPSAKVHFSSGPEDVFTVFSPILSEISNLFSSGQLVGLTVSGPRVLVRNIYK